MYKLSDHISFYNDLLNYGVGGGGDESFLI